MTGIKPITLLVALTLIFIQGSYGQVKIYGTWSANCPVEQINSSTIKFCAICPVVMTDKASVEIKDFEMTFDKDSLIIRLDNSVTTAKYKWNDDAQTIEFVYNDKKFKFRVLTTEDSKLKILKDQESQLITLTKK